MWPAAYCGFDLPRRRMLKVGLMKATPDGFELISSFEITKGKEEHWAHPVVCNGRLYIRHGDVLMVYNVKADS